MSDLAQRLRKREKFNLADLICGEAAARIETLESALQAITSHEGYSFDDRPTLLLQLSSIFKIARAAIAPEDK